MVDPESEPTLHDVARTIVDHDEELALDLVAILHSIATRPVHEAPMLGRLHAFRAALRAALADARDA